MAITSPTETTVPNPERAERPVLEVRDLTVAFRHRRSERREVLSSVSLSVRRNQTIGIVGESGCGKSLTSLAVLRLLPRGAHVESGQILLDGEDLLTKSDKEMRRLRGSRLAMVLQDPMTSLDPMFTVGDQLGESLKLHKRLRGADLRQASVRALEQVRIPSATDRLYQYPHQLSGGLRQRVTSAIALSGEPDLLIADEPTTALDVTTQARYLALLRELQQKTGFALILITHDLSIIRAMCQDIVVMYAGHVVETGPTTNVLDSPQHPYTRALFGAVPSLDYSKRLTSIEGQIPDPLNYPAGCRFAPRCKHARPVCAGLPELSPRPRTNGSARCFGTETDGWVST